MNEVKSKILVVDDDPNVVDLISDILAEYQYEVYAAFNGKKALEILEKVMPDLIVMDWEMPNLNGITTLGEMTKLNLLRKIPVIMISGRMTSVDNLKTAFDAGAIDFIRKPIEPVELIARCNSMLLLSKYYKESIRNKDWELTLLSKNNHNNLHLMTELIELIDFHCTEDTVKNSSEHKQLKDKIREMNGSIHNNSWAQFEEYFKSVHPDFSINLLNENPKLSPEDIRLCYFLRLNMSTKEIALITNKENHSIDIARYRLRKKFKLDRQCKLNEFLQRF